MLTDLRLPRASNRARRAATCTASKHSVDVAVRWNAGQSLAAAARLRESRAHSGSALGSAWRAAGEPQAAQLTTPSICACHAAMPNAALDECAGGTCRSMAAPQRDTVWHTVSPPQSLGRASQSLGRARKVWGLSDSLAGDESGHPAYTTQAQAAGRQHIVRPSLYGRAPSPPCSLPSRGQHVR